MKKFWILFLIAILIPSGAWARDWEVKSPANPPDARYGHSMVPMPDGDAMLFGGINAPGEVKNDMHVYANNDWTEVTPANTPPAARQEHAAWTRDGKMYVHGGLDAQHQALEDLWTYDPQSKQWTEIPTTGGPVARRGHSATVLSDGSVLIFGGRDNDHNRLGDLWKLKTDNTWEQLASYSPTSNHTAQVVGNFLYVFPYGGQIYYFYDTTTDQWSEGQPGATAGQITTVSSANNLLQEQVQGSPSGSFNGYATSAVGQNEQGESIIFIFGGLDSQANESDVVYEFNTATGELTQRAERMPFPLYFGASAVLAASPAGKQATKSSPALQSSLRVLFFGGRSNVIATNATLMFYYPPLTGLSSIEVSPDSVVLQPGQSQQFTATGIDSLANPLTIQPLWSATGGAINSSGLYTAGSDSGTFVVTATDTASGIQGQAQVRIKPGALAQIAVTPDSVTLEPGQSQQFTAAGADSFGNPVSFQPVWSATGGMIDSTGFYTAGSDTGTYVVTATDTVTQIQGRAQVRIVPTTGVFDRTEPSVPTAYSLSQNYPNPFAEKTVIEFRVKSSEFEDLQLQIYDLTGRLVKSFPITDYSTGSDGQSPITRITWDGRDNNGKGVPNGIYFYQIKAGGTSRQNRGDFIKMRKLIILR